MTDTNSEPLLGNTWPTNATPQSARIRRVDRSGFVTDTKMDHCLPEWTPSNRSIPNSDVALWYVFGIYHFTRPEGLTRSCRSTP